MISSSAHNGCEKKRPSALDHHHHLQVTGHGTWTMCISVFMQNTYNVGENLFHFFSCTKIHSFSTKYIKVNTLVNRKFMVRASKCNGLRSASVTDCWLVSHCLLFFYLKLIKIRIFCLAPCRDVTPIFFFAFNVQIHRIIASFSGNFMVWNERNEMGKWKAYKGNSRPEGEQC